MASVPGSAMKRDGRLLPSGPSFSSEVTRLYGIAVIAQFVDRQIARGQHPLPIARVADVQRKRPSQSGSRWLGDHVEALEIHRDDSTGSPSLTVMVTSTASAFSLSLTSKLVTRASG